MYEEQNDVDQTEESKFKFLDKTVSNLKIMTLKTSSATDLFAIKSFKSDGSNLNLFKQLEDLIAIESLADQYKLLATWLNDYAKRLVKLKSKLSGEQTSKEEAEISDEQSEETQAKEKRKNLIAEKRRAKIMAQLNQQQKNFIRNNQELFDETKAIATSVGSSSDFNLLVK